MTNTVTGVLNGHQMLQTKRGPYKSHFDIIHSCVHLIHSCQTLMIRGLFSVIQYNCDILSFFVFDRLTE